MSQESAAGIVEASTIRKGWWLAFARCADHAATFVTQVLIARWIGPDDFGNFAVALLVFTIVDGATESGVAAALVHRDIVERKHLDVAWTLSVIRGLTLGGLMLITAPLIAALADAPAATPLIRWMALVPPLRALCSPAMVALERRLAYRRLACCSLIESAAMFAATIALVPVLDGAGPLVGGIIVGEIARLVASYAFAPHAPGFKVDRNATADLLRYGRWVTGSSIALLLLLYMDDAVVAGMLGAGALALYQLAYQIAGMPASETSMVVGQVAFTAMSRLRDEPERLARSMLRSYELVASLAIPMAVALAVMAGPLIDVLLGERWSGAVPVVQVLAAWGVLRALGALTTSLFRAVGRPDIPARHHWLMVVCTAVALVPMVAAAGIVGAAIAVLVPNFIIHWYRYRDVAAVLGIGQRPILTRLGSPAIAGAAMGIVMAAASILTSDGWAGWTLLVAGVVGSATYLVVLAALEHAGHCGVLRTLRVLTRGAPA